MVSLQGRGAGRPRVRHAGRGGHHRSAGLPPRLAGRNDPGGETEDEGFVLKILDFGVAKSAQRQGLDFVGTTVGQLVGSPAASRVVCSPT